MVLLPLSFLVSWVGDRLVIGKGRRVRAARDVLGTYQGIAAVVPGRAVVVGIAGVVVCGTAGGAVVNAGEPVAGVIDVLDVAAGVGDVGAAAAAVVGEVHLDRVGLVTELSWFLPL